MNHKLVRYGLIAAGIMNIGGVLLFSVGLTNTAINNADPVVMSNFGLLMIIVWGLAYIGAATITSSIKWLAAVFVIEKLVYVVVWIRWMLDNSLSSLYSTDFLAVIFYSIYGINDFVFMLFFAWLFISTKQK
jgi:hypothetical protein